MNEMVERVVARAIFATGLVGYEQGCHEYLDLARAAVAATRTRKDEKEGRTIGPVWLTPTEASDAGLGEFYDVGAALAKEGGS